MTISFVSSVYKIVSTCIVISSLLSLLCSVIYLIKQGPKGKHTWIYYLSIVCLIAFMFIIVCFEEVTTVIGSSCDNAIQTLHESGFNVVCINRETQKEETDLTKQVKSQSIIDRVAFKNSTIYLYTSDEYFSIEEKSVGVPYSMPNVQYFTPGKEYKKGDYVLLGAFEQNNDSEQGPELIEWKVICVEENKILIISQYGLDYMAFQTNNSGPTWADSSLREWLNNAFYTSSFTKEEQKYILATTNINERNPSYFTDGGKNTVDHIFCLSLVEATKYFDSDMERIATPTEFALSNFKGAESYATGDYWWLRTLGNSNNKAASVRGDGSDGGAAGSINYYGSYSNGAGVMVRPALWLSTEPKQ